MRKKYEEMSCPLALRRFKLPVFNVLYISVGRGGSKYIVWKTEFVK